MPFANGTCATLGGTFDHFHIGHEQLIERGYQVADRVVVAVTMPVLHKNKPYAGAIQSTKDRVSNVRAFLASRGWTDRTEITLLHEPLGIASRDPSFHVVVVTQETEPNAQKMNESRRRLGLPPLEVQIVDQVLAEDGTPLSSSRIRAGTMDVDGSVFRLPADLSPRWQCPNAGLHRLWSLCSAHDSADHVIRTISAQIGATPSLITIGDETSERLAEFELFRRISFVSRNSTLGLVTEHLSTMELDSLLRRASTGSQKVTVVQGDSWTTETLLAACLLLAPLDDLVVVSAKEEWTVLRSSLAGKRVARQLLSPLGFVEGLD